MSFKDILAELSKESGLPLELDQNDSCLLELEDILITLQYRHDHDDIAIFAPVTDPEKIVRLNESALRAALSLSYNGVGTAGCYLGLFEETLVLTTYLSVQNLSAQTLALQLNEFGKNALNVRDTVLNAYQDIPATVLSDSGLNNLGQGLSV